MLRTLLINNGTVHIDELHALIPGEAEVRPWKDDVSDHEDFDLIVLSGSSTLPATSDKLAREHELVRTTTTPLIGICLGHQVIAHALGGRVEKMPEHHHGFTSVHVLNDAGIFDGKKDFTAWETHGHAVTKLGEGLITLAETDHAIAALKHTVRPLYGFQFHPEHHKDQQYGDEIFIHVLEQFDLI